MLGERIKRARLAAALSQRGLADLAGISAMAVSKFERETSTPTSKTLTSLARALGVRIEYFFRPETVTLSAPEYRKRSSLPKKALVRIEADILDQVERFVELVRLFPTPPVRRFAVPSKVPKRINAFEEVEFAAEAVRDAWQLGRNAIPNLADTLEEQGLLVLTTDVDSSAKFDGLAASVEGLPLVVVGANWPGDRQRFTLAHELGHLVLAGRLADGIKEEAACNRFAGAFLVPAEAVRMELGARRTRLDPRELLSLKHAYGLSMAAWIYRAGDVGVIDQRIAQGLFRLFSARGWRKNEPGEACPPEQVRLFEQLVLHALAEEIVSTSKAAELLGISIAAFRKHELAGPRDGAVDQ